MCATKVVLQFLFTAFILGESTASSTPCDDLEGYYWRHYKGEVPKDALIGGEDEDGNITYIGQTSYKEILIPGYIKASQKKMYFEWADSEHVTSKNIKILCTQHPEQFEWIRTNIDDITNLTEKNFVDGGFELDYTVYIGRVQVNDELAIGKVIITDKRARGFHTTSNRTFVHEKTFEVLNYEPDIPNVDEIRKSLRLRGLHSAISNSDSQPKISFCWMVVVMVPIVFKPALDFGKI